MNLTSNQLLLLVGICWLPLLVLGVVGFAAVLHRQGASSAAPSAGEEPVHLGTLHAERDGQRRDIGFQWVNGAFVANDGAPIAPTVIAGLDAEGRVGWGSEQQAAWFRRRYVEPTRGA